MAGDKQRQRIARARLTRAARGAGPSGKASKLGISHRAPGPDSAHRAPARLRERSRIAAPQRGRGDLPSAQSCPDKSFSLAESDAIIPRVGTQRDTRDARLIRRIVIRARQFTRANDAVACRDPDRTPCGMDRQTAVECAGHGTDQNTR